MQQPPRNRTNRRGITVIEVAVGTACATLIFSLLCAAGFCLRPANGEAISMANLMEIGTAHALYSWDWNGLQWCGHKSDFGLALNNCTTYTSTIGCPPQPILGTDATGGLWGIWISGALCTGLPGGCNNWVATNPTDWATFGSWRLMQQRSFHDYLNGRYYDEVFYAPNDARLYAAASRHFNSSSEFTNTANFWTIGSSYAMSPAAMWDPGVMRAPSAGGYQSPSTFPGAFERQSLSNAAYPELKSCVFEVNWNQQPPATASTVQAALQPFRYNQGVASRPITLFYDGHVWFLPNKRAIADDATIIKQGGSGLWHRGTPMGYDGYYNSHAIDSARTSHSVLTTNGILGRDLLSTQ